MCAALLVTCAVPLLEHEDVFLAPEENNNVVDPAYVYILPDFPVRMSSFPHSRDIPWSRHHKFEPQVDILRNQRNRSEDHLPVAENEPIGAQSLQEVETRLQVLEESEWKRAGRELRRIADTFAVSRQNQPAYTEPSPSHHGLFSSRLLSSSLWIYIFSAVWKILRTRMGLTYFEDSV